jgi:hypothetical protein
MKLGDYFGGSRTNVTSSILEFKTIDTDGMIKRMRLIEKAADRGRANQPSAANESLDSVEQDIVNEIGSEGTDKFSAYLEHQKTYADRASHMGIHALAFQLGAIASDAQGHFAREVHAGKDELHAAKQKLIDSERELQQFRSKHHLTRPARDHVSRVYSVGVLIFILAFESLLNGVFLAKGNMFGFAGGLTVALIISALNIAFAVGAGYLVFPWLSHRNTGLRVAGLVGVTAYALGAGAFNLGVAHYRIAVASDPFDASVIAWRSLWANPFGIDDMECWMLFIMGLFFSLLAAGDGYLLDDPYPGYGRRARQSGKAMHDYATLKDDLLTDLEDVKRGAERKMDDVVHSISTKQTETDHIAMTSLALRATMLQYFSHLEVAANTLLRRYRDENARTRTEPAPAHFDAQWKYNHPSPDGAVFTNLNRNTLEAEVRKAMEEAPRHRELLNTAYSEAMAEYRRIDELPIAEKSE